MIPENTINPFRPGIGQVPPSFPGRQTEQHHFQTLINELKQQGSPSKDTLLCAPRGNGKTALLTWLEKETSRQAAEEIDIIDLTPDDIQTTLELVNALAPASHKRNLLSRLEGSIRASASAVPVGIPAEASIGAKLNPEQQVAFTTVATALTQRSLMKPTLLILDEAHNLEQPVGQALLNASQKTKKRAPFLLVMAGTPGLRDHLGTLSSTFWERNHKIYPGLLSPEDSLKAILDPLKKYAITFDDETMRNIIKDCQGYPYFTQLWGEALFKTLQARRHTHIDKEIATQSLNEIETQRQSFYADRYSKIRKEKLLLPAIQLANHFENNHTITENNLTALFNAIDKRLPEILTPDTARDKLINEGYIWQSNPLDQGLYYPGIPTLMNYIKRIAKQEP